MHTAFPQAYLRNTVSDITTSTSDLRVTYSRSTSIQNDW